MSSSAFRRRYFACKQNDQCKKFFEKKSVDVESVVLLFKKRRTCDFIIFQMKHKK
jgi:hypothetical protein